MSEPLMTSIRPKGREMRGNRFVLRLRGPIAFLTIFAIAGALVLWPTPAQAVKKPTELKVAIVQFLSGAGAPHDASAVNAGKLLIDQINKAGGIDGVKLKLIVVDEAGSVVEKVAEYRRLVLDERVDIVIGYTSSAHCLAVAPVAEELKTLTVFQVCANYRLFEKGKFKYVFRTSAHAVSENVGAALYVLAIKPNLKSIAGMNYDYAYGRDSWEIFKRTILKLKPDVKVVAELWTKFLATEYTSEISKLLLAGPDVIHSVNWGAGLDAFIKQAKIRGLFEKSLAVLTTGLLYQAESLPKGVAFSGRGYHLQFPDPGKSPANREFIKSYRARYGKLPDYQGHFMAQAVLGIKTAFEKAIKAKGGQWPKVEEVITAFENLGYDTPRGPVFIRPDHQAVHESMWGITSGKRDSTLGFPILERFRVFPAVSVNPPLGVKTLDWIDSWPVKR